MIRLDWKDVIIAALAAIQITLFVIVPAVRSWWRKL